MNKDSGVGSASIAGGVLGDVFGLANENGNFIGMSMDCNLFRSLYSVKQMAATTNSTTHKRFQCIVFATGACCSSSSNASLLAPTKFACALLSMSASSSSNCI